MGVRPSIDWVYALVKAGEKDRPFVLSVSGGKDSTAMALALRELGLEFHWEG